MTPKSSGSGREKRRHARQATAQTAHIRFGEGAAIPCEVRDYCPTGLYVAFPGEATPDAALPALSLDDFGSGFTSYAHLKNLHTDALKIEGSFVRDMLKNPGDYAMVKSMNDIGHSLGLRTVAEYVESPMLLEALREIGVDYAQGYAIHKPCRIDELMAEQAV